jgi:hypothetical protein
MRFDQISKDARWRFGGAVHIIYFGRAQARLITVHIT